MGPDSDHEAMSEPALLRMPLHLLSIVLSQLDCTSSLASAIFSHSSFYAAFHEDRHRILRSILLNQIPPEMRTYAVTTYLSSSEELDRSDMDKLSAFLDSRFSLFSFEPFDTTLDSPTCIAPRAASSLSRTHAIIEHFTRDLLRDTLPLVPEHLGLPRRDCVTASADEVFRIHRAMYRFQLYCNLFNYPYTRDLRRDLWAMLHSYFFEPFSPWVNEQLACVHDYFERLLSRAFDEVAAHDVQWGYESVDWLSVGKWNKHKQGYGLEFLFKLHRAQTYDERCEILRTRGELPPSTHHMLATQFSAGSTVDMDDWYSFWENIDQKFEALAGGPRYRVDCIWRTRGPDVYGSGPFRMWRLAHYDVWKQDAIYHKAHAWLRRCGYVIWDAPDAPVSDQELRLHIKRARQLSLLDHFRRRDPARKAAVKRSWKQRAAIYLRGGRGHWSEGDLSRVTWIVPPPSSSGEGVGEGDRADARIPSEEAGQAGTDGEGQELEHLPHLIVEAPQT